MIPSTPDTENTESPGQGETNQGRPGTEAQSGKSSSRKAASSPQASAGKMEEKSEMQTTDLQAEATPEEGISILDLIADLGPVSEEPVQSERAEVSITSLLNNTDSASANTSSTEADNSNISILDLIADLAAEPATPEPVSPASETGVAPADTANSVTSAHTNVPKVGTMNETPTRPAELSQFTSPSLETGSTAVVPAIEPHKPVKINKVAANPAPTPTASAHEAGSGRKSKRVLESDYDQVKLEFQFHRIVQQLEVLPSLEAPLVIGVASTLRGEGRSTIALGLASAISQEIPLPVVLIETDLSKPALAEDLNMPNKGLSEYLRGEIELDDLIQSTALADLAVIVSGDCQGQALKLLRSERLTHLLSILSQQFAAVVLDLPPMSQAGESARVISQIDRVLMVVEAGSTPKNLVKNALEMIPEEKLAGVLLNRTRPAFGLFQWIKRLFR